MSCYHSNDNFTDAIENPQPAKCQVWKPTLSNPYPLNFVQAPSASNQVIVYYNGKPYTQGLSVNKGPVMFPGREITCDPKNAWERKHTIYPRNCAIRYPTTHSVPGPFLQSYIHLPQRKMYMY